MRANFFSQVCAFLLLSSFSVGAQTMSEEQCLTLQDILNFRSFDGGKPCDPTAGFALLSENSEPIPSELATIIDLNTFPAFRHMKLFLSDESSEEELGSFFSTYDVLLLSVLFGTEPFLEEDGRNKLYYYALLYKRHLAISKLGGWKDPNSELIFLNQQIGMEDISFGLFENPSAHLFCMALKDVPNVQLREIANSQVVLKCYNRILAK